MSGWRSPRLWPLLLVLLGISIFVGPALALPGLPVIRWDPIRQVWVDAKTKGVVTVSSNTVTQPQGTVVAAAAAPAAYTQQGNTRPQRPSAKEHFPLVIPDLDWWKNCDKNSSDILTMMTTKCDIFKDIVNCQQLAQMGYLPSGIQSFVPHSLHGGFTLPNGCSSGNLGVEYDGLKMVFNSPQIPIMAVIAKDLISKVFYFGSGVTQGKLLKLLVKKVEFCYAPPSISPLYVSKTAAYSTGMQPGSASWNFFKTAQLAPPFTNNIASLFRGDAADVTWNLQVQKTGTDTIYQGAVTGQITVTNPQATPVTVYSINDYVQGGPSSTVSCGTQLPFQIPPCSSSVCNYVGYWPLAPAAGTYTNLADVSYSVGDSGTVGNQVGTSTFQVGTISPAVGMLNTPSGQQIPAGQAVVADPMAPQAYFFSGSAQQSYTSQLTCPETAIITNQATLTAATGQQITQSATVQKLCFDLQVRVAQAASPFIGKWAWAVDKQASVPGVTLKPSATAWDKYVKQQLDLAIASGQDPHAAMDMITGGVNTSSLSATTMEGYMTGDVTYKVTFTRTPPGGIVAGAPAFQAVGDVFITNPSPLNAQLKEVTVSISNPFGGVPYRTTATCPILTVAAGQTLQCRYVASPPFNPIGAQVVATAHYLNMRNGVPTGATTPFSSAATTMAGGSPPQQPQPLPQPLPQSEVLPGQAAPQLPMQTLQPVASRRLLSSVASINDALSNIVRRVSVTTTDGNKGEYATNDGSRLRTSGSDASIASVSDNDYDDFNKADDAGDVSTAVYVDEPSTSMGSSSSSGRSRRAGSRRGTKLLKDIVNNVASVLDEKEAPNPSTKAKDKKESGDDNGFMHNVFKTLNATLDVSGSEEEEGSNNDVAEMLMQLLPKLPSMGINIEGGDWHDLLEALQEALPDQGFAGMLKKLGHMPKMPSFPPKLPKLGPTITINSTGPEEDDYEEKTLEGLSKALTKLTHLIERNDKSTITVTTRSMTPEAMLGRALERLSGHQHDDDAQGMATLEQANASGGSSSSIGDDAGSPAADAVAIQEQASQAPLSPYELKGLSDECVDVNDVFTSGSNYATGMVVSGSLPNGRICDTTTFTYAVRYGPYAECFSRKAVNKASFKTTDTATTGDATSTVNVEVQGCGPAVTANVKSYAVWAKKGYTWTVQKSVEPAKIQVQHGQQASATYSVSYIRHEVAVAPKLSVTVQFDNLNINSAIPLSSFNYKVTSHCPEGHRYKSGTFNCGADTIPAGGAPLSCKFKVDLPCASGGVLIANAVSSDKAIRSSPFKFPAPEATELADASGDQLSTGECVMVTDEFKHGDNLVSGGKVTDPAMVPYGKLCGSKDFTYTATFGPFNNCGKKKVVNIASLSAGTPDTVQQSQVTLPIHVMGCAVYIPAKAPIQNNTGLVINVTAPVHTTNITINKGSTGLHISASHLRQQQVENPQQPAENPAVDSLQQQQQQQQQQQRQPPLQGKNPPLGINCVSPVHFWKACMHKPGDQLNGRCAVVLKLPAGPLTPFFPQPGSKNTRNYKGVMGKKTDTGNKSVDLWFKAAHTLIATQLNEMAGVVLPEPVRDAVSLIGSVVGTTSTTPPTINMQLPGLATAINLLEMFNGGQAGVEAC